MKNNENDEPPFYFFIYFWNSRKYEIMNFCFEKYIFSSDIKLENPKYLFTVFPFNFRRYEIMKINSKTWQLYFISLKNINLKINNDLSNTLIDGCVKNLYEFKIVQLISF